MCRGDESRGPPPPGLHSGALTTFGPERDPQPDPNVSPSRAAYSASGGVRPPLRCHTGKEKQKQDLQSVQFARSQEKQLGEDGQMIPIQAPGKTENKLGNKVVSSRQCGRVVLCRDMFPFSVLPNHVTESRCCGCKVDSCNRRMKKQGD